MKQHSGLFSVVRTLRVRNLRHSESAGYGKRTVATPGHSWVVLALLLSATMLPASDRPADDTEHLLYLADHGFAVIRLRIEIDGRSQPELCHHCLRAICGEADRDQDGFLTPAEYDARVAVHPVLQERKSRPMQRSDAASPRPDFGPADKLPVEMAAAYLMKNVWQPLVLEFASSQLRRISAAGELLDRPLVDTQLFARLDIDGNRKLTSRELERAALLLTKFDFDEDELISLEELQLQPSQATAPSANPNRAARKSDGHLSQLSSARIDSQFVRRVLSQYDGDAKGSVKDLRLDRTETGLSNDLFVQADADQDGFWDFDELRRFLERPVPSAEIEIHLVTGAPATTAEFTSHDLAAVNLLDQRPGAVRFEMFGVRFELRLPASKPLYHGGDARWEMEFKTLDDNKDESLEAQEYPFGADGEEISPIFREMDADADGRVSLAEYLAHEHRRQRGRASQLVLTVENLQRTLFGPLDANGDGRLSPRELARLKDRLPEWDANHDGKLEEAEIPQQYRLTLSRSEDGPESMVRAANDVTAEDAGVPIAPLWFRKMDRNHDGEVSPREFLGTKVRFEEIDANSDGAIDADEARKVK